jgi:hypothetical protein
MIWQGLLELRGIHEQMNIGRILGIFNTFNCKSKKKNQSYILSKLTQNTEYIYTASCYFHRINIDT